MAKALPKKYFPGWNAKIYLSKVDRWAEMHAKNGVRPYFDTWKEAHDYMVDRATRKVVRLEKELAAEKRHLAKVQGMTEPVS